MNFCVRSPYRCRKRIYFALLGHVLLLLAYPASSTKRQLINFQVYEENNVYHSELNVNSIIDLNFELRQFNDEKHQPVHHTLSDERNPENETKEFYKAIVEIKSPIQMKINGTLSKINWFSNSTDQQLNASDANVASHKQTASDSSNRTLYALNLNMGELYKVHLNVNHLQPADGQDEFVSELDFNSLQSKIAGKYRGNLVLNKNVCPKLTLYHNFTTSVENLVRFSSNLTEQCQLINDRNEAEDQMKITIDFSTLINDLFNFKLDQVFIKQINKGSELMTLLNRLYKITVSGDYQYVKTDDTVPKNLKYKFNKKATFESSQPEQFPSFQIKYSHDDKKIKLLFESQSKQKKTKQNLKDEERNEL